MPKMHKAQKPRGTPINMRQASVSFKIRGSFVVGRNKEPRRTAGLFKLTPNE